MVVLVLKVRSCGGPGRKQSHRGQAKFFKIHRHKPVAPSLRPVALAIAGARANDSGHLPLLAAIIRDKAAS